MLLTRSCVLDRIMELELIRIEMIKSSESVINHYQNPHKMPLRGHLALQVSQNLKLGPYSKIKIEKK